MVYYTRYSILADIFRPVLCNLWKILFGLHMVPVQLYYPLCLTKSIIDAITLWIVKVKGYSRLTVSTDTVILQKHITWEVKLMDWFHKGVASLWHCSIATIPHICPFTYTDTFWGLKIVHSKVQNVNCKITHCVWNYTLYVKLHTVCKITDGV